MQMSKRNGNQVKNSEEGDNEDDMIVTPPGHNHDHDANRVPVVENYLKFSTKTGPSLHLGANNLQPKGWRDEVEISYTCNIAIEDNFSSYIQVQLAY